MKHASLHDLTIGVLSPVALIAVYLLITTGGRFFLVAVRSIAAWLRKLPAFFLGLKAAFKKKESSLASEVAGLFQRIHTTPGITPASKGITMAFNLNTEVESILSVLTTKILPAYAEAEKLISPGVTQAQLSATLISDATAYATSKFGFLAGLVLDIPIVKTDLAKAVAAVVAAALPVLESPALSEVDQVLGAESVAVAPPVAG